jgi:aminoglycoside N3'-acetyltransferase
MKTDKITVTKNDITKAARSAGLSNKCVCVHSSLKSFGEVTGGAETVVEALLDAGCTVMVPSFSFSYAVMPPEEFRYKRNGADYSRLDWIMPGNKLVYAPESNQLDLADMGKIPEAVLNISGRVRGDHPLCSFTAAGPFAAELIKTQRPMDVYAPLRELALFGGYIVLMGVGLTKMTALHLAEQMAGRNMFIRWANGPDKKVITAECGGDSLGFEKLAPYAAIAERRAQCGNSLWRVFETGKLLKSAARAIMLQPGITHCGKKDCLRCDDAVKGGVIYDL